jgi:hypothetical protein
VLMAISVPRNVRNLYAARTIVRSQGLTSLTIRLRL